MPALGTGAAPIDPRLLQRAMLIQVKGDKVSRILMELAKNKMAQGNEMADPSMLTLAPIGNTTFARAGDTPPSTTHSIEIGKVAA